MTVVVDASVAVKWLLPESGSISAQELLADNHNLVGPSLLRVEVAAAIARKVRFEELDVQDGDNAITLWLQFLRDGVITLSPDEADLPHAWNIAVDLKHPLQDCLYLALAERIEAQLITADAKFAGKAGQRHTRIRLLDPTQPAPLS